jgi:WD40 repeat protein
VDWSADGRQIVASSDNQTFRVWNVDDATIAVQIDGHEEETSALAWHPRLRQFAVASPIRLCNVDGTVAPGWEGHRGRVYDLAWNPVDERLASVGIDGTLRLWKVDGAAEGVFTSGELMASVAWKPNGKQLASGADSGSIQLWHPDGRPASLLRGHSDRVTSIAWSTDGRWLASGSRDNTIRVWSEEGEPLAVLRGHTGEISAVSWQPHSSRLLSGSSDGTISLWDIDVQAPEWTLIPNCNGQSIRVDFAGHILSGDRGLIEREFAYVVEQPTGAMEVLVPSEFQTRIKLAH